MRRFAAIALVAAFFSGGAPLLATAATPANSLSPAEIKATFGTGTAFSAASPSGAASSLVLKPDGTASRTPKGSKAAVAGTWRVSTDGYCSKWGKNPENCYTIQKNGDKYTVLDSHGKIAARWTK